MVRDAVNVDSRIRDIVIIVTQIFIALFIISISVYGISEDAFGILLNYGWAGNVRELENLMEMLVVLNESGLIAAKDIPEKYKCASAAGHGQDSRLETKNGINIDIVNADKIIISVFLSLKGRI